MSNDKPAWSMLPQETERQFRAFQKYLHMLDDPDETQRSGRRLAIEMGYADDSALEIWSAKNNWVARARAYDDYMSVAIVQREVTNVGAYQDHVIESLTQQLNILDRILNTELMKYAIAQETGDEIKTQDIKRLVDSVKAKDDLARRVGRMPTNFITEPAEKDDEQHTYVIGEDDD